MTLLTDWEFYVLVLAAAVGWILVAVFARAYGTNRRELELRRAELATKVDPCADPIALRLACLQARLDALAPAGRPRRDRAR